jgi:hypothetical protein
MGTFLYQRMSWTYTLSDLQLKEDLYETGINDPPLRHYHVKTPIRSTVSPLTCRNTATTRSFRWIDDSNSKATPSTISILEISSNEFRILFQSSSIARHVHPSHKYLPNQRNMSQP